MVGRPTRDVGIERDGAWRGGGSVERGGVGRGISFFFFFDFAARSALGKADEDTEEEEEEEGDCIGAINEREYGDGARSRLMGFALKEGAPGLRVCERGGRIDGVDMDTDEDMGKDEDIVEDEDEDEDEDKDDTGKERGRSDGGERTMMG